MASMEEIASCIHETLSNRDSKNAKSSVKKRVKDLCLNFPLYPHFNSATVKCPRCNDGTKVLDSRVGSKGSSVRRRRECESCEHRFTTFEHVEDSLPLVVKKDGTRESFDRYKIFAGIRKACEKRPVSIEVMEEMVDEIVKEAIDLGKRELDSVDVGEMVVESLRNVDQVSYVRFASVYREFSDVNEFMETLRNLVSSSGKKGV